MNLHAHDRKGRSTTHEKWARNAKIDWPFAAIPWAMLESPAWLALSPNGRRVVDRLIVEHGHHGGKENGRLPCAYTDFVNAGVRDGSVSDAIREAIALGFIKVTERGRAGNGEFRRAAQYELTFLNKGPVKATHDWQRIETRDDAERISAAAREKIARRKARIDQAEVAVGASKK